MHLFSAISHAIVIFLATIALSAEAAPQQTIADVQTLLEHAYAADEPGAAILIVTKGEILYQDGFGLANMEHGVDITPDTIFRIGSVTKQFTATAIMMLQEQGKLSVTDSISQYLPDYPTHGHTILIEHLLTHTSGIMSYTSIPGYMGSNEIRHDVSTAELIEVFRDLPMEFAPGTAWNYNNSGYVLLGAIIEKISGQTYAEFIAENITTPLGLSNTTYAGSALVKNRAAGYSAIDGGGFENAGFLSMSQPYAAGSLLSTVNDLATWQAALTNGDLINSASYAKMTSPVLLADGEYFPYGYGFTLVPLRGHAMVSHSGGIHGFICQTIWLPEQEVYVAVLSNTTGRSPDPDMIARNVAAIAINDPYPDRKPVNLDASQKNRIAGKYSATDFPPVEISTAAEGLLISIGGDQPSELLAENRKTLFLANSMLYIDVIWDDQSVARLLVNTMEGLPPSVLLPVTE